jgi:hypothetical protein
MDEITVGPTVTRYALKPAEGVRISKIVSLQSNLELALAASPFRIEAPIPGKSLVGIEVPNTTKATLGLASLLGSAEFMDNKKPLMIALGRDITGVPHFADIAKMPHGLIAGATGSGKSVTIHDAVISLLYRNGPDMLRMIMIDPKRVELTLYNGIPHLLTPVITDAVKTVNALKWTIGEMDRRFDRLEVAHLADQHDVRILPQRRAQRVREAEGVGVALAVTVPLGVTEGVTGPLVVVDVVVGVIVRLGLTVAVWVKVPGNWVWVDVGVKVLVAVRVAVLLGVTVGVKVKVAADSPVAIPRNESTKNNFDRKDISHPNKRSNL